MGNTRRDLKLPVVDTSTVSLVTPNQTCTKALAAFNSTLPGVPPLPSKIDVAKIGAVYAAMYPFPGVHQYPWPVLDSKYKVLSKFARNSGWRIRSRAFPAQVRGHLPLV